ncbi:MAG: hypothetical protein NVS3B5_12030 [Sphingomicrobium sp.]
MLLGNEVRGVERCRLAADLARGAGCDVDQPLRWGDEEARHLHQRAIVSTGRVRNRDAAIVRKVERRTGPAARRARGKPDKAAADIVEHRHNDGAARHRRAVERLARPRRRDQRRLQACRIGAKLGEIER